MGVHKLSDDFVPASSLAPIPGSSYSLRIGKIGDKWAIRVYRGPQVLTTEVIGELDPQLVVTVAQSAISLPSYSPYHIVRAVSPLIREARSGYVPPPPPPVNVDQANAPNAAEAGEPGLEATPAPRPRATGMEDVKPSSVAQPVVDAVSAAVAQSPKPLEKRRPLVEIEPLEPIRIQKKLVIEPIRPEDLNERLYSTLMNRLGLVISYVYNNYGEKSGTRLWQYMQEIAELSQGKSKKESFEDFVKKRVQEDRILGIEHQVSEFYDNKLVSHVRDCKLKSNTPGSVAPTGRVLEDLPCMLCEATWQGSCHAMGFQLQITKEKDGCTISVEKIESRK
jgi:hypothetical protein